MVRLGLVSHYPDLFLFRDSEKWSLSWEIPGFNLIIFFSEINLFEKEAES